MYFNEEGNLLKETHEKIWKKWKQGIELDGVEAALWLATEYAARTHGNYTEKHFFDNTNLHRVNYITIKKQEAAPLKD